MKLQTLLLTSLLVLFSGYTQKSYAQNVNRIDEEQILDQRRKERVEAIIRQREEEAKKIKENPELYASPEKQQLVEVEPNNILPADLSNVSALVPYRVRRKPEGVEVGLKYSFFDPTNYESDYASSTIIGFSDLYGSAPLLEVYANYKLNLTFGSLGAELGYGIYSNDVDDTSFGENIKLELQVISLGAKFILDAINYEPYVAPYIGGGIYTVLYRESNGSNSFNGNTQLAPYISAGVLLQLNWLDSSASVEAYSEGGIENTFLFAEVKQFMASTSDGDPDFSTDPTIGAGFSLEF